MKNKKPNGYWKSEENVIAEARKAMEEQRFDRLPPSKKLAKLGYSSLVSAITKYHGGFFEFRKKLGQKPLRFKPNIWRDLDFTLEQARKIMQEQGLKKLPNMNILIDLGYSGLATAIGNYHGGFTKFRDLLGEVQENVEYGGWRDLNFTLEQAIKIMQEQGFDTFPSGNKLRQLGYSGFVGAVYKHHGGFRKFRGILNKKLGMKQEESRKPRGYWQDLRNVMSEVIKIIEENDSGVLPSKDELYELGHSSLATAITKYHGGFRKIRRLLGEKNIRVEEDSWKSLDFTIGQAVTFMQEHEFDILPSGGRLSKMGYSSLSAAILKYHGGFPVFRKVLHEKLGNQSSKEQLESLLKDYVEV